jgi:hypothetical protein
MIFFRQQYIDLLTHRINEEFGRNPSRRKKNILLADYCDPRSKKYDRHFIRILLAGFKFANIAHNNHDISSTQIEALINFFQVSSWADFYIVFKFFPIMPIIITILQLLTFITLLSKIL